MARVAAIIVAAGRGERFGTEGPKQYETLGGIAIIRHALGAFINHAAIDAVVPVIHPDDTQRFADAAAGTDCLPPVHGGATRQQSVLNGLRALENDPPDYVLIHDAARPLVPSHVIDRIVAGLDDWDAVVPGVPVADTLKRIDADGAVSETVPRDGMWRAQTPQGFRFNALLAAHVEAVDAVHTDDAAVMEAAGHRVALVPGDEKSMKVTTQDDLSALEKHMQTDPDFRTGQGFDVHRLGPGDGVTLCGVTIPCAHRLIGHSDADVALHAVTDAILGALGAGDIGDHFPPSDPQWRGAASSVFLAHACELAAERGYAVGNVDLTVVCEVPKIAPFRDRMRRSLADIMAIEADRISVKATTTEALGFTGRGEGIAAQASVLLRTP